MHMIECLPTNRHRLACNQYHLVYIPFPLANQSPSHHHHSSLIQRIDNNIKSNYHQRVSISCYCFTN